MKKILIIYTGGTIGMVFNEKTGTLKPFNFKQVFSHVPELKRLNYDIKVYSFKPLIDSSNMQPSNWVILADIIEKNYESFDGFVILHGSDTMSYTASALSFMLENLNKPVVLTGSQLPIGEIRTDAKENLITALEIAAAEINGKAAVPEVCVYFDYQLFRGNRSSKFNSAKFEAFHSVNYPVLAEAGVHLKFNSRFILKPSGNKLKVHKQLETNLGIIRIFPGMSIQWIEAALNAESLKAVVIETFGSGNAPTEKWLINSLRDAINKGILIFNVTQCGGGTVEQGRYETSKQLDEIGVISGKDMTTEAAITKLMVLLGQHKELHKVKRLLSIPLCGEITFVN